MLNKKAKQTRRRFYNKWLYKVTLRINGSSSVLLNRSIEKVLDGVIYPNHIDYKSLTELAKVLLQHSSTTWAKRTEGSCIDIYTNNPDLYTELSQNFNDIIVHQYEPDPCSIDILDQPQSILSKKLPHNKYQYRVYIYPHKFKNDLDAKKSYIDWIRKQGDRINCSLATENWIINTNWNWDRRYVLVEDENTLLLLKLRNSEVTGKVYKYVIPINT